MENDSSGKYSYQRYFFKSQNKKKRVYGNGREILP